MAFRLKRSSRMPSARGLGLAFAALALSACATQQPAWLQSAVEPVCADYRATSCIANASADYLSQASPEEVLQMPGGLELYAHTSLAVQEVDLRNSADQPDALAEIESFARLASATSSTDGLPAERECMRNSVRMRLWSGHAVDSDRMQLMAELSECNLPAFIRIEVSNLYPLLELGDYERASALAYRLLSLSKGGDVHAFTVATIAGAYACSGLVADASELLASEVSSIESLADGDRQMIQTVIEACTSGYPSNSTFMAISDPKARLEAHLVITGLTGGNTSLGRGAAQLASMDTLKFLAKRSSQSVAAYGYIELLGAMQRIQNRDQ